MTHLWNAFGFVILHFFCESIICQRAIGAGWSSTFYTAARSMVQINPAQIPESLTFHQSTGRIITSNIVNEEMYSVPYTNSKKSITFFEEEMLPISSADSSFGVFGIVADPINDSYVWAALAIRPPVPGSICAFEKIDTTSNQTIAFYNFSSLRDNSTDFCWVNDLAIDGLESVYATDYWGYRIYKLDQKSGAKSVLNSDVSLLCGGSGCSGSTYDGPNGIALYTDVAGDKWLLIAIPPARLVKLNALTGVGAVITAGDNTALNAIYNLDGITLYDLGPYNSVLYAVGKVPGTQGTIQALTSTDEWSTFDLRVVYNANCADQSDTAVRTANDDVVLLCNNNFNYGTMYVNVLRAVAGGPIPDTIEVIAQVDMVPESFGYDANRNMLVFGSLSDGSIRGYPYNGFSDSPITYTPSSLHTYIASGTAGIYSSAGIQVNPTGSNASSCFAFVCMGSITPDKNAHPETGLYLVDLCTDNVTSHVELPPVPSGSFANDVTVLDGVAYVSDLLGDQVWAVTVTDNVLSNPRVLLTAESCAINDPSFCVTNPDGMVTVEEGVSVPFILMSMISGPTGGLMKYVPSTKALTKVDDPTGLLTGFDGMVYSRAASILYGTRNSLSGTLYQTVFAMASCDEWGSAEVLYAFQLDCGGTNAPAVTLVDNAEGGQDLLVLCNDGFGSGPYSVQRVSNVNQVVANKALCSGTLPTAAPVASSNGRKSGLSLGAISGIAIGAIFLVGGLATCAYYHFYHNKKAKDGSLNTALI